MRALARRLRRLEERLGPTVEAQETRHLRARLEAARLRCGLTPIPPERLADLRHMSIVDILHSGRRAGARRNVNLETR
jgi:hypothetical protein